MTALIVVEAVAILLLGLLVAGLLRSHAEILRKLHELGAGLDDGGTQRQPAFSVQPGVPAPTGTAVTAADVAGVTPTDEAIALGVVGTEHHTLLAFLSSGCSTCAGFWRAFGDGDLALPDATRLVIVTKGPQEESESTIRRLSPGTAPVVMSTRAWEDYGVPGSPYFVYVDGPSGRVAGEGAATSWEQVASLLGQAVADGTGHPRGRPGGRGGRRNGDAAREARADRELKAAGIHPGHASLYPDPEPEEAGR